MQATANVSRSNKLELTGTGAFSQDEASALFEATAQQYLDMTGDEFLRQWDAQAFNGDPQRKARAMRVAALIPLVRTISARKKSL